MTISNGTKNNHRGRRITRDSILFILGILGIMHETLVSQVERPFLLGVFLTMLGMPVFLKLDELRRKNGGS